MQLPRSDLTDLLRGGGGLLFATGATALFIRKSDGHGWSNLALLLVIAVPAVILYMLALGVLEPNGRESEDPRPWQSVLMVAAILLMPLALTQLLQLLNAAHHLSSNAGVFALTGLLAVYAADRARIAYAALLASIALSIAWLLIWEKILAHPSTDAYRALLVVAAALLLLTAFTLARAGARAASEVATAGGIAAIAAGALGVIDGFFTGVTASIFSLGHDAGSIVTRNHHLDTSGLQHFGWDLYLLIVSLALVWVGVRTRTRGLGYAGATGLLAFTLSIGIQITQYESGRIPSAAVVGWPLALLVAGATGLAAPALLRRDS